MSESAIRTDTDRIRLLNDNFRSTLIGGQIVMTSEVAELPLDVKAHVLLNVQRFTDFNADNDPHGEHDCGSFEFGGVSYLFKIDYYSPELDGGSEDPADPEKTARVLTIMRADEY